MGLKTTDGGRPVETTAADVLETFRERDDLAEPLTSNEVADRAGCSRRTALNRLHDLADAGDVASKKVGGRARVWWVPHSRDAAVVDAPAEAAVDTYAAEQAHVPAESAPDETSVDTTPERDDGGHADDSVHDEVAVAVARAAEHWDDDSRLADRRAAATAVLSALRDSDDPLSRSDIVDRFYDEYPVAGQAKDTWWRRNLAEGADGAPAPLRLVASYSNGVGWEWTGLAEAMPTEGGIYDPSKER
jgi:hypothetical protein